MATTQASLFKKEEAVCLERKSDENHPTVHNVDQKGQEAGGCLKDALERKKRRTGCKCVLLNLSNNRNVVMLKEEGERNQIH